MFNWTINEQKEILIILTQNKIKIFAQAQDTSLQVTSY